MNEADVVIIGAGASGLLCAIEAARRGRRVLLLEKGRKPGRKILIAGGGRCNFTNLLTDPRKSFLSRNPHFCISALRRYTPEDFVALVEAHGIPYHEKKLGQLFCDRTSQDILDMLLDECTAAGVHLACDHDVQELTHQEDGRFLIRIADAPPLVAHTVVVASGGLSIPNLASDFALRCANRLGLEVVPPRAGLVPFTWNEPDKARFLPLSGISLDVEVTLGRASFRENLLFTHRGLSGPAILQISSYWREGEIVSINLLPDHDALDFFTAAREENPGQSLSRFLASHFPSRFVERVSGEWFPVKALGQLSKQELQTVADHFGNWQFKPGGTEGYRTAEVTLGGVSTDELSSKSFECRKYRNLYFIGEAVDVTGWLGGYNFQWAWASAYSAAQSL